MNHMRDQQIRHIPHLDPFVKAVALSSLSCLCALAHKLSDFQHGYAADSRLLAVMDFVGGLVTIKSDPNDTSNKSKASNLQFVERGLLPGLQAYYSYVQKNGLPALFPRFQPVVVGRDKLQDITSLECGNFHSLIRCVFYKAPGHSELMRPDKLCLLRGSIKSVHFAGCRVNGQRPVRQHQSKSAT